MARLLVGTLAAAAQSGSARRGINHEPGACTKVQLPRLVLYLRNVWGRNSEILAFGGGRRPVYETRHHAMSTPNRCIWRELGLGAEGRADCPRPRSGLNTPIDRFFNLHITPTPKINQSTPSAVIVAISTLTWSGDIAGLTLAQVRHARSLRRRRVTSHFLST